VISYAESPEPISEEITMRALLFVLALSVCGAVAAQGVTVTVEATGSVVFNVINDPPLSTVNGGEDVVMSFTVDSDNFVEGVPGDTRGYVIDHPSFALSFSGGVTQGLIDPFPGGETPYFTLVDGFPVSDGFFVSTSPFSPGGVPLEQDPINANLDLGYEGTTLASLDILDALGVYGYGGLTRFGFNLWAIAPHNVGMEIDFIQLSITGPVPVEPSTWGSVKETFK
jgi:hypothetical protein